MFSMLVFMYRDPGDTTSKVSCCVEASFDFDASVLVLTTLNLKVKLLSKSNRGFILHFAYESNLRVNA